MFQLHHKRQRLTLIQFIVWIATVRFVVINVEYLSLVEDHSVPDRGLNSGPPAQKSDTLPLDRQVQVRLYLKDVYPHLHGRRVEKLFGKTTLNTADQDSNVNLPVIGSLVFCESSALDHVATEPVAQQLTNCMLTHLGNTTPSSSDRDSNLDLTVLGSLAQHKTSVLANYATEALANALVVLSSTAEDGEIEVRISVGCREWIQRIGPALSKMPFEKLNQRRICAIHFTDNQFMNIHRNSLIHCAVPTLHLPVASVNTGETEQPGIKPPTTSTVEPVSVTSRGPSTSFEPIDVTTPLQLVDKEHTSSTCTQPSNSLQTSADVSLQSYINADGLEDILHTPTDVYTPPSIGKRNQQKEFCRNPNLTEKHKKLPQLSTKQFQSEECKKLLKNALPSISSSSDVSIMFIKRGKNKVKTFYTKLLKVLNSRTYTPPLSKLTGVYTPERHDND
ncbi:unnamed protein product [Timema podura]|uniref:THAP-type domain-containing protein n=1 Tax=Timema podura TaxID=61482 RepID=A0ABN7NPH0_TIMPD|nr:unnamed protein product [Timema podura]